MNTVLIVEDDINLLGLYARALTKAGYGVDPAATIYEARRCLNSKRYDVVICDMQLNESYGLDLLRQEWEHLQAGRTQVLVVSGQEAYREACAALGFTCFAAKPVSVFDLTALVRRLTEARQG